MSGGSRSQEWRVVCDDDEEMTIQRWFSRREQNSAHLNSPSEKSKGNKNGASLDQPKDSRKPEADGSRSTRGGAVCGILSTRQTGTTGPTPKGSPLSYPTLSSAGAAKKVQFSEDDIIQVMSPQPRGTPFVKPDRYQSRKLRRTAARMKLYQKKYGTPLPEEFYDVTPPSLVEALDKEMAEQIRKKLRSKIMSQIRLQQLSTRSSEDDHLPLLDKCDKPNCRKKGSCLTELAKQTTDSNVTPASPDKHTRSRTTPLEQDIGTQPSSTDTSCVHGVPRSVSNAEVDTLESSYSAKPPLSFACSLAYIPTDATPPHTINYNSSQKGRAQHILKHDEPVHCLKHTGTSDAPKESTLFCSAKRSSPSYTQKEDSSPHAESPKNRNQRAQCTRTGYSSQTSSNALMKFNLITPLCARASMKTSVNLELIAMPSPPSSQQSPNGSPAYSRQMIVEESSTLNPPRESSRHQRRSYRHRYHHHRDTSVKHSSHLLPAETSTDLNGDLSSDLSDNSSGDQNDDYCEICGSSIIQRNRRTADHDHSGVPAGSETRNSYNCLSDHSSRPVTLRTPNYISSYSNLEPSELPNSHLLTESGLPPHRLLLHDITLDQASDPATSLETFLHHSASNLRRGKGIVPAETTWQALRGNTPKNK
ncbi:uncharacterized protein LOC111251911 isoform X1 [Varroa destructor]|uniref:Uncharacterized protein n=1 Tax=Varroa destructor TaxID=109461 RepID=A0A7M7KJX3_VARDE|nr:uncharacterized protein LOC111251911 isoform X1 [Varroa destructor]